MTEFDLLHILLLVSMAVAPYGTSRFVADPSPRRVASHLGALACAAAGLFSPLRFFSVGWLIFCAGSLGLFVLRALRQHDVSRAPHRLTMAVPLLFSNIAAVWLVGGTSDLRILGYGPAFSFYAALHGNVLGWMVIGAMAALASEDPAHRRIHVTAVLVSFLSFLSIAVGIDQLRALEVVGMIGLSVAIPVSQLAFLSTVWTRHRLAFALGGVSLLGLLFTMLLAWQHELNLPTFPPALGVRSMVSVHGLLNAVVVGPSFLLAVALAARSARAAAAGTPPPPARGPRATGEDRAEPPKPCRHGLLRCRKRPDFGRSTRLGPRGPSGRLLEAAARRVLRRLGSRAVRLERRPRRAPRVRGSAVASPRRWALAKLCQEWTAIQPGDVPPAEGVEVRQRRRGPREVV